MSEDGSIRVWGPVTRYEKKSGGSDKSSGVTAHRAYLEVFSKYKDSEDRVPLKNLRKACNDLDLYPSMSQVHEMVNCAVEYGSPCEPEYITYGEFCVLVAELQIYYSMNPVAPKPLSLVKTRSDQYHGKRKKRVANEEPDRGWSGGAKVLCILHHRGVQLILAYSWARPAILVVVFLGGSCNPTSWRADIAIPFLKENGITFYNPQVQCWKQELMELEQQAKQMAEVLFFVIDSKTRAISSMIEVAYLVACKRQVVVMMFDYKEHKVSIGGRDLSNCEMTDISRGRLILTDLVERNSVPVFSSIQAALQCTKILLRRGVTIQDLTLKDGAQPVRYGYLKLGEALLQARANSVNPDEMLQNVNPSGSTLFDTHPAIFRHNIGQLREAFNSVDNKCTGYLSSQDVCLAYKSCTAEELDIRWLKSRCQGKDQYVFEEFCGIVTEYRQQTNTTMLQKFLNRVLAPVRWLITKLSSPAPPSMVIDSDTIRDVYLGGSCGLTTWRSEIAAPLLRKNGLSYVDPTVNQWDQKLIPMHVSLREKCRLLLYFITGQTRSLCSMLEAGYYIGKGCRLVLCLQKIQVNTIIGDEKASACAVQDYNRGRDYLCDLASREGVPIFDDITEAVLCAISLLCTDQQQSSSAS